MNMLFTIDQSIINLPEIILTNLLLFGDIKKYSIEVNSEILTLTIEFIVNSNRFDESLL